MKKSNNTKTRKIAAALAALSIASAMALPASSAAASAAESSEIVYELPEIDTNPAVIQETDEAVELLETVTTIAGELEQVQETPVTSTTRAENKEQNTETATADEAKTKKSHVRYDVKPKKEADLKQFGFKTADAALEAIGKLFPGGEAISGGLRAALKPLSGEPDYAEAANALLDSMNEKIDEMDTQLQNLNSKINRNTDWMSNKVENCADLSDLKNDFRSLSPEAAKLVKDIKSIQEDESLNKSQKIARIAAITDTARFDRVTTYIYKIMKAMGDSDAAYTNMFDTLYKKEAAECMFSKEAYKKALPVAEALTKQYIYAVSLVQECQIAAIVLEQFGENEVAELEVNENDLAIYENFDFERHNLDENDPADALKAVEEGLRKFSLHYKNSTYINKGTENRKLVFDVTWRWNDDKNLSDPVAISGKNTLSADEIMNLADYVKTNYPGTSIYDFLQENDAVLGSIGYYNEEDEQYYDDSLNFRKRPDKTYLVVGKNLEDSYTKNNAESHGWKLFAAGNVYDHKVTCKAIDIKDPEVKVVDIVDYEYKEKKAYTVFIKYHEEKYNVCYKNLGIVSVKG